MPKKKKKKVRVLPPAVRIEVRKAYDLVAPLRRKRRLTLEDLIELQCMGERLERLQPFSPKKAEAQMLETLGSMGLQPGLIKSSQPFFSEGVPKFFMYVSLLVTPLEEDLT